MGGGDTGSQRQSAVSIFEKRLRPNTKFMDFNSILPCSTVVQMQKFLHYGEGHEPPTAAQFDAHEPK